MGKRRIVDQTEATYFMINSRWEVKEAPMTNSKKAKGRFAVGNKFKTKKEAEEFAQAVKDMRAGKLQKIGSSKQKRPWWAFWRV